MFFVSVLPFVCANYIKLSYGSGMTTFRERTVHWSTIFSQYKFCICNFGDFV